MGRPLRLMIYDATCTGRGALPGLTHSWIAGALLYRALGRLDAFCGVRSWEEGLAFVADHNLERPISEVQFWGHGKWGEARVDGELLDERSLLREHEHEPWLRRLRARFTDDALFWFRTCETVGAHKGQRFARQFGEHLNCAVAGHTYIIGPWQSGLHRLERGATPHWDPGEGLEEGTEDDPKRALWSGPSAPNTITCLHGAVPADF